MNNVNQEKSPPIMCNNKGHVFRIGPYVLSDIIGRGNFSVVREGLHIPTQMKVAVKILNKSKMSEEVLRKTFREVNIMKQISHPNIVKLFEIVDGLKYLFIVMELLPNGELFDHLVKSGRISEAETRIKFNQILDAVEYCHQMNIVHRDLKAENLLFDQHNNVKLVDFGFGCIYDSSSLLRSWCGSPPYAAPELFKGEPYSGPKADIWSLGVILYVMVCGALPFNEPCNIVKLREQVLSGWIRFPYFLSYDCENLIRIILNRVPNKRPSIQTIRKHKWMAPVFDKVNDHTESSDPTPSVDMFLTPVMEPRDRQGRDSGYEEQITESHSPPSPKLTMDLMQMNSINKHALQIMKRHGLNLKETINELSNKTYGPLTATYLLLLERLKSQHQIPSVDGQFVHVHRNIECFMKHMQLDEERSSLNRSPYDNVHLATSPIQTPENNNCVDLIRAAKSFSNENGNHLSQSPIQNCATICYPMSMIPVAMEVLVPNGAIFENEMSPVSRSPHFMFLCPDESRNIYHSDIPATPYMLLDNAVPLMQTPVSSITPEINMNRPNSSYYDLSADVDLPDSVKDINCNVSPLPVAVVSRPYVDNQRVQNCSCFSLLRQSSHKENPSSSKEMLPNQLYSIPKQTQPCSLFRNSFVLTKLSTIPDGKFKQATNGNLVRNNGTQNLVSMFIPNPLCCGHRLSLTEPH